MFLPSNLKNLLFAASDIQKCLCIIAIQYVHISGLNFFPFPIKLIVYTYVSLRRSKDKISEKFIAILHYLYLSN